MIFTHKLSAMKWNEYSQTILSLIFFLNNLCSLVRVIARVVSFVYINHCLLPLPSIQDLRTSGFLLLKQPYLIHRFIACIFDQAMTQKSANRRNFKNKNFKFLCNIIQLSWCREPLNNKAVSPALLSVVFKLLCMCCMFPCP
jgi:hypothetical protein